MKFAFLPGECWWVGRTFDGVKMPLTAQSVYEADLKNVKPNAGAPLMLSSKGRWVSSRLPFIIQMESGMITVEGANDLRLETAGGTLQSAYRAAAEKYFVKADRAPAPICFTAPSYNSWIEVGFETTQEKVLNYARGLINSGAQPGILMIDDNWMVRYGRWRFDRERFPDPHKMVDELHAMGFRVMLWICPYTVASGHPYLELKDEKLLVMNTDGTPKLVKWWNGVSCIIDVSNEKAVRFLTEQLDELVRDFGVDGFKLDAGDPLIQDGSFRFHRPLLQNEDDTLYSRIGLKYPICEYRESWAMGGAPLMLRQQDKAHTWDEEGIRALIPNGLALSMMGYHYHCPDMVGGGDLGVVDMSKPLDQELFVRCTQASALFPIIQFSMAPHHILDERHYRACEEALAVRARLTPYIMERVDLAMKTQEPIFAPLAYHYPGEGLEGVTQGFCLGSRYIVYPIVEKGQTQAVFKLPQGMWKDWRGKVNKVGAGESLACDVALNDLPLFEKVEE